MHNREDELRFNPNSGHKNSIFHAKLQCIQGYILGKILCWRIKGGGGMVAEGKNEKGRCRGNIEKGETKIGERRKLHQKPSKMPLIIFIPNYTYII